jgi:hypothetical protein
VPCSRSRARTAPAHRARATAAGRPSSADHHEFGTNLEAFDRDGIVMIPELLSPAEARRAVELLDARVARARREPAPREQVSGGTLHLPLLDAPDRDGLPTPWDDPRVLVVVRHHLGDGAIVGEASYRAPRPGHGGQTLHVDWTEPVRLGDWRVATLVVALVPFTADNGPTRVVPGSHRERDPHFRATSQAHRHPGERPLVAPAGTGFVFSGHLLHSGTTNRAERPRHALLVSFARPQG